MLNQAPVGEPIQHRERCRLHLENIAIWAALIGLVGAAVGATIAATLQARFAHRAELRKANYDKLRECREAAIELTRAYGQVWWAESKAEHAQRALATRAVVMRITLAFGNEELGDEVRSFLEKACHWKAESEHVHNADAIEAEERRVHGLLLAAIRDAERRLGVPETAISADTIIALGLVRRPALRARPDD